MTERCKQCGSQLETGSAGLVRCAHCDSKLLPPSAPPPTSQSSVSPPPVVPPPSVDQVIAPPVVSSEPPVVQTPPVSPPQSAGDVSEISLPPVTPPVDRSIPRPERVPPIDVQPGQINQNPLPPIAEPGPAKQRPSSAASLESQDDFTLLPSKATAKKRKTEQTRPQQNGVDKNNPDQNLPTAQPGYPATPPKARSKRRKTGPQKKELPESLLPQKSKTSGDEPLLPAAKKNGQDDELLPQAATAKPVSKQEVEHGSVPGANLNQNVISEDEKVLLPDGHGGFIEVSERKTTVSYRGAKIELSSMKREDREVSRTLNNFIVATVSIILLVTLMVVLKWLS